MKASIIATFVHNFCTRSFLSRWKKKTRSIISHREVHYCVKFDWVTSSRSRLQFWPIVWNFDRCVKTNAAGNIPASSRNIVALYRRVIKSGVKKKNQLYLRTVSPQFYFAKHRWKRHYVVLLLLLSDVFAEWAYDVDARYVIKTIKRKSIL